MEFYYVRRQGENACRRIHGKPTGALQIHSRVVNKIQYNDEIMNSFFLLPMNISDFQSTKCWRAKMKTIVLQICIVITFILY